MRIPLSTAIDAALYHKCKARGMKWNQLIAAGFQHMTSPNASIETVRAHTEEIEELKKLLNSSRKQVFQLRTEMEKIKSEVLK